MHFKDDREVIGFIIVVMFPLRPALEFLLRPPLSLPPRFEFVYRFPSSSSSDRLTILPFVQPPESRMITKLDTKEKSMGCMKIEKTMMISLLVFFPLSDEFSPSPLVPLDRQA